MFKKIITIVPVAALLTVGATAQASTITVEKGDTLWGLARENNTTVETIQTVNHLTTDLIYPGDLLTIAKEKQHTVKLGDTLWDIAIEHDVTISQIKEWNNLKSDLIHPGLNLLVYEGAKDASAKGNTSVTTTQPTKESTPKVTVQPTETKEETPKETAPAASSSQSTEKAAGTVASNETVKERAPETAPAKTEASKEIMVEATAYTASCEGCSGITSTGINLIENPDAKVISVDPTVIPLGSKVFVEGYGEAIAGDTGGGIIGNKIDVFIPSKQDAINFGVKQLKVTILD